MTLEDHEIVLRKLRMAEEAFLRKEDSQTVKIKALLMQHATQVIRTRAQLLYDVLDRAFDALLKQYTRHLVKSTFRALRVAVMERLTVYLRNQAQLRNWLRLCRRLIVWERHVDRFYALKVKYRAFRRLFWNVVTKMRFQTPGLSDRLRRRRALLSQYEAFLEQVAETSTTTTLATKYSPANTFQGVWLRWVAFTQWARTTRGLVAVSRRKQDLWTMWTVFQALKTQLKVVYTFADRWARRPFLLRQCRADLDLLHTRMMAWQPHLQSTKLRRALVAHRQSLQQTATGAPTVKQLFQAHEKAVRERLALENKLMLVAYNERKVHHYEERLSELCGAPTGRAFAYEPAPPYSSICEIVVLTGKKVDGLSLVVKTNTSATFEGALHGNPFGNREVFTLSRSEKLVYVEGYASQSIFGLRFGTTSGRLSKWFGHSDKGTRFELRADVTTREEIVGVFGYADATSLHGVGVCFRHTTLRNIFEGLWLQDESSASSAAKKPHQPPKSDQIALADRHFAYFLQVRTCDVLLAMRRAHKLALRMHRNAFLTLALSKIRVIMGLMRWLFNALAHGLVQPTSGRYEEEQGQRLLTEGMRTRAAGEKLRDEGKRMLQEVDSYRAGPDQQLNVATLGVKKVTELGEMQAHGEQNIQVGTKMMDDGQGMLLAGRKLLPHLPMTKRMMTAIRNIYKVVQTKDYIDQMDPDLRAILLEGDAASAEPTSIYDQL